MFTWQQLNKFHPSQVTCPKHASYLKFDRNRELSVAVRLGKERTLLSRVLFPLLSSRKETETGLERVVEIGPQKICLVHILSSIKILRVVIALQPKCSRLLRGSKPTVRQAEEKRSQRKAQRIDLPQPLSAPTVAETPHSRVGLHSHNKRCTQNTQGTIDGYLLLLFQ